MDEKKMLNGMELHDEELDKVVGGAVSLTADGRVEIDDSEECSCRNPWFFKDRFTGLDSLQSGNWRCSDCVYWSGKRYCTNPDVAASLAK